jgi:hypothetical protein
VLHVIEVSLGNEFLQEVYLIQLTQGNVVVRPLKEEIVRSPEEVLGLLERGQKNRRTGATDWVCSQTDRVASLGVCTNGNCLLVVE